MELAQVIQNGRNQEVHLPNRFRLSDSEVLVQRLGEAVMLLPKEASWQTFLNGLNGFTDDFLQEGRERETPAARDAL